jgi:hypothetical protein
MEEDMFSLQSRIIAKGAAQNRSTAVELSGKATLMLKVLILGGHIDSGTKVGYG